jgi:hypothetical protein
VELAKGEQSVSISSRARLHRPQGARGPAPRGRADTGMIASAPESLVVWIRRAPNRAGPCQARAEDHFSLDRVVDDGERSLALVVRELQGRGRAWT